MRHWQAAAVLLLFCFEQAISVRELLNSGTELDKRGAQNTGPKPRTLAFDPAATAQLDSAFVRDLTGENSTDNTYSKQLTLNLTSPAGTNVSRRTVAEVNREAPLLTVPLRGNRTISTRPHLSIQNPGLAKGRISDDKPVHSMQDLSLLGGSGANLDLLVGVRVATPGWGSGFNFCIGMFLQVPQRTATVCLHSEVHVSTSALLTTNNCLHPGVSYKRYMQLHFD